MGFEPYEEKNIANRMRRCEHFTGLLSLAPGEPKDEDRECKAGVRYRAIKTLKPAGGFSLPCFKDPGAATCDKAAFMTREQAEADWLETKAHVAEWSATIARGECPTHKRPVKMRQVGSCVYGDCGCRMYQGKLPKGRR